MAIQQHDASQAPPTGVSRRKFLLLIGAGLNAIAAALLAAPILGYVFASFGRKGPSQAWISLGPIDTYPENQTRLATYRNPFTRPWDGTTANIPCWVRRITGEQFQVFAVNCTHLGCPVRWFQASRLFLCPCHGGVFYEDGSHASGPPRVGSSSMSTRLRMAHCWCAADNSPRSLSPSKCSCVLTHACARDRIAKGAWYATKGRLLD